MSESYCYTVNNRLFSYQYTRNPIVTNEIASNHLNFQQTNLQVGFIEKLGRFIKTVAFVPPKHTLCILSLAQKYWKFQYIGNQRSFYRLFLHRSQNNRYIFDILSMQQKGRIQIQPFRCFIKETGDQISCCR